VILTGEAKAAENDQARDGEDDLADRLRFWADGGPPEDDLMVRAADRIVHLEGLLGDWASESWVKAQLSDARARVSELEAALRPLVGVPEPEPEDFERAATVLGAGQ
jgi:hypothetical protein